MTAIMSVSINNIYFKKKYLIVFFFVRLKWSFDRVIVEFACLLFFCYF